MSTLWTVTPRSAAIAFQVETFASWSRVVTTTSSRGPSVAPMLRPMCRVRLDMFWPNLISSGDAAPEEVGDRGVRLLDHRVGLGARRERALVVRVHVAVVADDGIDHALRDLRAAGSVEERDRAAVLLAGERGELGAKGIDIEAGEGGHRGSGVGGHQGRERTRPAADSAPTDSRQPP